jgi:hypothetical protein
MSQRTTPVDQPEELLLFVVVPEHRVEVALLSAECLQLAGERKDGKT